MASLSDLIEAFGEQPIDTSKLHPDLRGWVQRLDGDLPMLVLRHPLVYQVPFYSWKHANDMLEAKVKNTTAARLNREWEHFLFLHERPWRLVKLHELFREKQIRRMELRKLLPMMWIDTENPFQFDQTVLELFDAAGYVTDGPREPVVPMMVYRGQKREMPWGVSWTRDPAVAFRFARRFAVDGDKGVARMVVQPENVLAQFDGRGEAEVVVDPDAFRVVTPEWLPEGANG